MAVLYLLEAKYGFDESRGVPFGAFAYNSIYNRFCSYFEYLQAEKRQYIRADLYHTGKDEGNSFELSIPAKNLGIYELSYRLLCLDIEMQLKKIKKDKPCLLTGVTIIEQLVKGKSPSDIMRNMGLQRNTYNYRLLQIRRKLRIMMSGQ